MRLRLLVCAALLSLLTSACRKAESMEAVIAKGDVPALQARLAKGVAADSTAQDGRTLLAHAISAGKPEVISALIAAGANAQSKGPNGTLLHAAAAEGQLASLAPLVAAGVPVDATNGRGDTALHVAARHGHLEVAKALLRMHHADAIPRNIDGQRASEVAKAAGHTEVFALLAGSDAITLDRRRLGRFPLERALTLLRVVNLTPLKDPGEDATVPLFRPDSEALVSDLVDCDVLHPIAEEVAYLESDLVSLYYGNSYLCRSPDLGPIARSKTYHDNPSFMCSARASAGALLAHAADRSPASVEALWTRYKETVFSIVTADRFRKLGGHRRIERLLVADVRLSQQPDRADLLAATYKKLEEMHADPAKEDDVYGWPWCEQLEGLPLDEEGSRDCWAQGFWVRRHAERNTEVVRGILLEIQRHYAKLTPGKGKPARPCETVHLPQTPPDPPSDSEPQGD